MQRDIVYNITTFTDICSTVNLAATCKIINKYVKHDSRYVVFQSIYLYFIKYLPRYDDVVNAFLFKIIRINRYFYYKVATTAQFWQRSNKALFNYLYYKQLSQDKTLVNPQIFYNPLYHRDYYNCRRVADQIKPRFYLLNLYQIIQYLKYPGYTNPVFKEFIDELPNNIIKFTDIEFTQNFNFLIGMRYNVMIDKSAFIFKFKKYVCRLRVNNVHIHGTTFVDINKVRFSFNLLNTSQELKKQIIAYFMNTLQINSFNAGRLADLTINILFN